jgi:hypothetical protein
MVAAVPLVPSILLGVTVSVMLRGCPLKWQSVLMSTPFWSLLLHDIANRSSTFSQDNRTHETPNTVMFPT